MANDADDFPVIPHEELVRKVIRDEVGIEDGGRTPAPAIADLVAPGATYDQAYLTALQGKVNAILAALRTHGIITDPNAPVDPDAAEDAADAARPVIRSASNQTAQERNAYAARPAPFVDTGSTTI